MKLLLHVCCAPCLVFPLTVLRREGLAARGFFFNPNIQPYAEFRRRLETLEGYCAAEDFPLVVRPDYDLEGWLRAVVFRESQRCHYCYYSRLEATARLAKKSGFTAFSTTLLYSRRQKHDLIAEIGFSLASTHGLEFWYHDFRQGWKEGQLGAKAAGLYRQDYCGCVYSERDRRLPRKSKSPESEPGVE